MIKRFIYIWIAYWGIFLLQPVSSIYNNLYYAFFIQIIFVVLVSLSYFSSNYCINKKFSCLIPEIEISREKAILIINIGLMISFIGILFLIFDKIFIQGIDYSQGMAYAREQWRQLGEERSGEASSIYTLIGYPLSSAYFISLMLLVSVKVQIKDHRRFFLMVLGVFCLMANSMLIGGRSAILLALTFLSFSYFNRQSGRRLFFKCIYMRSVIFIIFLLFFYILYIFQSRASAGDVDINNYSIDFLYYLGLKPYEWFKDLCEFNFLGSLLGIINLAISYLTHSISTIAGVWEDSKTGIPVFNYALVLLNKVKIIDSVDIDWVLSGRFISLPGGIYFLWGFLGLTISSIIIGIIISIISSIYRKNSKSISMFFLCSIFESILLGSPFGFMGDSIFFPFLIFGGFMSIMIVSLMK